MSSFNENETALMVAIFKTSGGVKLPAGEAAAVAAELGLNASALNMRMVRLRAKIAKLAADGGGRGDMSATGPSTPATKSAATPKNSVKNSKTKPVAIPLSFGAKTKVKTPRKGSKIITSEERVDDEDDDGENGGVMLQQGGSGETFSEYDEYEDEETGLGANLGMRGGDAAAYATPYPKRKLEGTGVVQSTPKKSKANLQVAFDDDESPY